MNADEAQAEVARCLADPGYLDSAAESALPGALHDSLYLFRGFIARIKHTQLRRVAPLTLRLLGLHCLDIAFFAQLAPSYMAMRAGGQLTTAQLFAGFERQLTAWLSKASANERDQLNAILRHETRIWRTGQAASDSGASPHPRLRAGGAVERFALDVLALAQAVAADPFAPPATQPGDQFVLYHLNEGTVYVNAIDPLSAWLLGRLDGSRPPEAFVAELSAVLGADAQAVVRDLFADAQARGLLNHAGT